MRPLVLKMSMTLDGFVGGPNGETDLVFRGRSEDGQAWLLETLCGASLHFMGSKTFKDMAAWWPHSNDPYAAPMNEIPKAVWSRSGNIARAPNTAALESARKAAVGGFVKEPPPSARSWDEPLIVQGDLKESVARLKEGSGSYILAHGGAAFARALIAADLVDEYRLLVQPVALGRGLAIFSELDRPRQLSLKEVTAFKNGAVAQIYTRVRS